MTHEFPDRLHVDAAYRRRAIEQAELRTITVFDTQPGTLPNVTLQGAGVSLDLRPEQFAERPDDN